MLMGLAVLGCGDKNEDTGTETTEPTYSAEPAYGVPTSETDMDGDGWSPFDGDCDDEDPAINPGATETAGDGIDSNCDGEDDT